MRTAGRLLYLTGNKGRVFICKLLAVDVFKEKAQIFRLHVKEAAAEVSLDAVLVAAYDFCFGGYRSAERFELHRKFAVRQQC